MGRGEPIGAGYAGVEVPGGCDWVKREGDWFGHINQKPSGRGSVLANEMREGSFLGRGDPIGAGYAGVEVLGGCDWVKHKGGLV